MDLWNILVGFMATMAVCSGFPRRSNSGVSYVLKQSRQRNPVSRRPAIRSKLSLPLKPNTNLRHHLSVKKLPVPDGHLNIIKQTVVLKSPKKMRGKSKQIPKTARIALPQSHHNKMPAYNPVPTSRSRGRSKNGRGRAGHAGPKNSQKNNMAGTHPALLPALNSLNQNLGGLLDAIRGTKPNNGHGPQHSSAMNTQTNAPLPIIVMDNTGHFTNPHGAPTAGPYSNALIQDPYGGHLGSLAGALPGLAGHLPGLHDLGFSAPGQGGAGFGHHPSAGHGAGHGSVGVSLPSHGSSSIGFSVPGSARLGLSVPGHGGISVGVSGPAKSGSVKQNSKKSNSSRQNNKNELIIMPNGPNTKAIRISTNGNFNYAKIKGQNNKGGIIFRSSKKAAFPSMSNTTPSGEDPPEVGELGEQP